MSRLTYCIVDGKVCKSFNDMFCCKECQTYYQYVLSRGSSTTTSAVDSECLSNVAEDAADDLEFEEECFSKPALTTENTEEQVYYHSSEEISELDEDSELSSEDEEEEEDNDFFNIYTTSKRSNRDSIFSIYKGSRKSHESHSSASSFENMSPLLHKDNNHYKCIKFDSLFVPGPKQHQQPQLNCIETLVKNEQDSTNYKKLTTIPQNSYQIWIKNQN